MSTPNQPIFDKSKDGAKPEAAVGRGTYTDTVPAQQGGGSSQAPSTVQPLGNTTKR